jgi:hypothetical protein
MVLRLETENCIPDHAVYMCSSEETQSTQSQAGRICCGQLSLLKSYNARNLYCLVLAISGSYTCFTAILKYRPRLQVFDFLEAP